MSMDVTLKIEGINGESEIADHEGEIDILSWSMGVSQSGNVHIGGGGTSGKSSWQDLSVVKWEDMASVPLMKHCATGKHIEKMTLTVRKAGGDESLPYVVYEFEDVIVSSLSSGGSGGEDRLTENVSFNFRIVKKKYTKQTQEGGGDESPEYAFDIAKNKEHAG